MPARISAKRVCGPSQRLLPIWIVHDHPGHVEWPRRAVGSTVCFPNRSSAPAAKLGERHGVGLPSADVPNSSAAELRIFHLPQQQLGQVRGMQSVAHLMAGAVEPEVFQRSPLGSTCGSRTNRCPVPARQIAIRRPALRNDLPRRGIRKHGHIRAPAIRRPTSSRRRARPAARSKTLRRSRAPIFRRKWLRVVEAERLVVELSAEFLSEREYCKRGCWRAGEIRPSPAAQYSSKFTAPERLCSMSWRLLVLPSMPASTLGLAAASIIQSQPGSDSKSLAQRTSRVNHVHADVSAAAGDWFRFPAGKNCRCPKIFASGRSSRSANATCCRQIRKRR